MTGVPALVLLWTLIFTHGRQARGELHFLERREGESVVLPCALDPGAAEPYGFYLKRSWRSPAEVLFMLTGEQFTVGRDEDRARLAVSGDPASRALNVSLSRLRPADTDRYHCEFVVNNQHGDDPRLAGTDDFFLLVAGGAAGGGAGGAAAGGGAGGEAGGAAGGAAAGGGAAAAADGPSLGSLDVNLVETCAGGSAELPCLPPLGEAGLAVEGVSLRRRRGGAPVELLYRSPSSPSPSLFPEERLQLTSAPGPHGLSYSLTLLGLQRDDSGAYSCQLLLRGRAEDGDLGRGVSVVSVRGPECGCGSDRSTLLYVLSSAVAVLLLLLLLLVAIHAASRRGAAAARPQAPIYEEMAGVQPSRQRLNPGLLDPKEDSEYKNCPSKKFSRSPENHYETPRSARSVLRGGSEE